MLLKIVLFILGIFLISLSIFFIILYSNMIYMGYSFIEFLNFILTRFECFLFIFGIILLILSIGRRKK